MERYLKPGDIVRPKNSKGFYEIKSLAGIDLSCILYFAEYNENGKKKNCLLKEYNPDSLLLSRNSEGTLLPIDEDDAQEFREGMKRFAEKQKQSLLLRLNSKNLSQAEKTFSSNGTMYRGIPCIGGQTYDRICENSLYDLMQRAKSIALSLERFHFKGLLHLGLRPECIMTVPENPGVVMIFETDSISRRENVMLSPLSYVSSAFKAPEMLLPEEAKNIGVECDIFSLGEIIFYKMLSRHSLPSERHRFSVYSFDDLPILKDADPKAFPLISELFTKTLAANPEDRYSSAGELICQIDKILACLNPKDFHLLSSVPDFTDFHTGRDNEISVIHELFKTHNKIYLYGKKGEGKTSLLLSYVKAHRDLYNAVIYVNSAAPLAMDLKDDKIFPISGIAPMEHESSPDYLIRKKKMLTQKADFDTLIIIDKDNLCESDDLAFLLSLPAKIIITGENPRDIPDFFSYELSPIRETCSLVDIFYHYYEKTLTKNEETSLRVIFSMVDNLAESAVMLGKAVAASRRTPDAIFNEIISTLTDTGRNFHKAFFKVFPLTDNEKYILLNLSLFGKYGTLPDFLSEKLSLENFSSVKALISGGIISSNTENCRLSLSSAVRAYILDVQQNKEMLILPMLSSVSKGISDFDFTNGSRTNSIAVAIASLSCSLEKLKIKTSDSAEILLSFAKFLSASGNYEASLSAGSYAVKILEPSGTVSPLLLSDALNTAGETAVKLMQFEKAAKYLFDAEKILRLSHSSLPLLSAVYKNIALLKKGERDISLALKYIYRHLDISKNLYGTKSKAVAEAEHILGQLCSINGRHTAAADHFTSAYTIRKALFGPYSYLTALSALRLGEALIDSGDCSRGATFLNKASKGFATIKPGLHLVLADLDFAWGKIQVCQSNSACAKEYFTSALFVYKLYDKVNSRTACTLISLGRIAEDEGSLKSAKAYYLKAMETEKGYSSKNKRRMISILSSLGNISRKTEKLEEASAYFTEAIALAKELYGEKGRTTKRLFSELEYVSYLSGSPSELSPCIKSVYRLRDFFKKFSSEKGGSHPSR